MLFTPFVPSRLVFGPLLFALIGRLSAGASWPATFLGLWTRLKFGWRASSLTWTKTM